MTKNAPTANGRLLRRLGMLLVILIGTGMMAEPVIADSAPTTTDLALFGLGQGRDGEGRKEARREGRERGAAQTTAGLQERTISVGGMQRSYLIHVPPSLDKSRPAPLVLVFHGGGGRAQGVANTTGMHELADQRGFIVVYPNGTGQGKGLTWNAGGVPPEGYAEVNRVDDVGFVRALVNEVTQTYNIDRRRIFATGMSRGGMLSYLLACEMSDVFAAIAPVAAAMTTPRCAPREAVAVLHIHGDQDKSVPLSGGSQRGTNRPPVINGIVAFAKADGCSVPTEADLKGAGSACWRASGCSSGRTVAFCLIDGHGHAWPGAAAKRWQEAQGVPVNESWPASEKIWEFFAANPK